jgi:hypothetical protein
MARAPLALFLLPTTLLATLSCGSSSSGSGGSCPQTTPCGGNLVGTWDITASCGTGGSMMSNPMCPGENVALTSVNETGSFTFNMDGTYATMGSISVQEAASVPLSCLSMGGGTATCGQLAMALNAQMIGTVQPDGGVSPGSTSATCSMSGANCECNVTFSLPNTSAMGTYTTSGTGVTLTPNGGGPTTDGYCVQGSTLTLATTMGATTGTLSADLILKKR